MNDMTTTAIATYDIEDQSEAKIGLLDPPAPSIKEGVLWLMKPEGC